MAILVIRFLFEMEWWKALIMDKFRFSTDNSGMFLSFNLGQLLHSINIFYSSPDLHHFSTESIKT